MKKTDKKIERAIVVALTEACEAALTHVPGFSWITHFVNFARFPGSLVVVAVFETDDQLRAAQHAQQDIWLTDRICAHLRASNTPVSIRREQIHLDTEEACQRDNSGNWQERYQ